MFLFLFLLVVVLARCRRCGRLLLGAAPAFGRADLRVREGRPTSKNRRWLGPGLARYHLMAPSQWSEADDVPASPFVGVRIWRTRWNVAERGRTSERRRSLLYEWSEGRNDG